MQVSFIYSFMSLILIILALGIPIVITVLLLKHFSKQPSTEQDYLLEKIRELEGRIESLEENSYLK